MPRRSASSSSVRTFCRLLEDRKAERRGIVVLAQSMVLLVRGFDLSIASVMATAAVIATEFDETTDWSVVPIAALTLALCLVVGLANGLLVTKRRVSPFLATLATMIVLQGARFAWTRGAPSGRVPELLK